METSDKYKAVIKITNVEKYWPEIVDEMRWLLEQAFIVTYNRFADESEKLYKEWNKEFDTDELNRTQVFDSYEAFIANKMQNWFNEHVNWKWTKGMRLLDFYADTETAEIYAIECEHEDVVVRMHLEKI